MTQRGYTFRKEATNAQTDQATILSTTYVPGDWKSLSDSGTMRLSGPPLNRGTSPDLLGEGLANEVTPDLSPERVPFTYS